MNYAIIGISLAEDLEEIQAVLNVALVSIAVVPLVNIYAVIALTWFIKDEKHGSQFKATFIGITKSPLILGI